MTHANRQYPFTACQLLIADRLVDLVNNPRAEITIDFKIMLKPYMKFVGETLPAWSDKVLPDPIPLEAIIYPVLLNPLLQRRDGQARADTN